MILSIFSVTTDDGHIISYACGDISNLKMSNTIGGKVEFNTRLINGSFVLCGIYIKDMYALYEYICSYGNSPSARYPPIDNLYEYRKYLVNMIHKNKTAEDIFCMVYNQKDDSIYCGFVKRDSELIRSDVYLNENKVILS